MADNTSAGATPAVADATSAQTAGSEPDATPATGEAALGESGKKALEAERAAAKAAAKRADDAEKALKALQDAQLSEAEKRDKRLAELEGERTTWEMERQRLVLERSVERQAVKAGADPEIVLAMVLANRASVEYEPDGTPKNLDKIIGDLVKSKPSLLLNRTVTGSSDLGTGSAGRTAGAKTFTRDQLKDPTFYQANKADILAAMREGRITG